MQTLHKKMGRGTRILQKARKDGRGCSWCCDCCFDGDQWSFCLCGLRVQRRREVSRAYSAAPRRGSRTQLEAHLFPRPCLPHCWLNPKHRLHPSLFMPTGISEIKINREEEKIQLTCIKKNTNYIEKQNALLFIK